MAHFSQSGAQFALLLRALILAHGLVAIVNGDEDSRRLLKDLFPDACFGHQPHALSALVRPVQNYSEPVVLSIGLTVLSVLDLNFLDHSMTSYVWLSLEWRDSTRIWDQQEYGGVESISVPPTSIWTPDLSVYNDILGDVALPKDKVLAYIQSTGLVHWIVPVILKTSCNSLNNEAELQNCEVKFGSWIHDASKIELRLQGAPSKLSANSTNANPAIAADISSVVHPVRGWRLQSAIGVRHVVQYACCPSAYNDVTYTFSFVPHDDAAATATEAAPEATTRTAKELSSVEAEADSKPEAAPAPVAASASVNATAATGIWNRFPSLQSFTWKNIIG